MSIVAMIECAEVKASDEAERLLGEAEAALTMAWVEAEAGQR